MSFALFGGRAAALAGVAARRLGWAPNVFWAATPAEVFGALVPDASRAGGAPLGRAEMLRMMERDHGE